MADYVAGKYEGIVDPAAEAFWLKCGMDPKMAKEFVGAKVCRFLFSDMGILWFQCNSKKWRLRRHFCSLRLPMETSGLIRMAPELHQDVWRGKKNFKRQVLQS